MELGSCPQNGVVKWKPLLAALAALSIFGGALGWLVSREALLTLCFAAFPWIVVGGSIAVSLIFGLPMIPFMLILRILERHGKRQEEK